MNPIRKRARATGARGTISSSRTVKKDGESKEKVTETSKEITTRLPVSDPAYVRVDGGITKNLGDYNSAKIGVSVSLPCLPDEKSIRECYAKASALVDEFMDEEYKAAIGETSKD